MIVFGAISPHPPIIIPEIGGSEIKKVEKTIKAMKKLTKILKEAEPDTLIVISPHGLTYPDRMNVCSMPKLEGDMAHFGHPEIKFKYENDLDLAIEINKTANKEGIETLLYDSGAENRTYELDHGVTVPLYYLTANLTRIKVLPIAYSLLDRLQQFGFGQVIAEVTAKDSKKRIAIIASGDLSHRLIPAAPAGYTPTGEKFDKQLIKALGKNDTQEILNFEEDFLEEAGECGYRSILILLGALNDLKTKPEVLSYQGPFGVGYAVVEFRIMNKEL